MGFSKLKKAKGKIDNFAHKVNRVVGLGNHEKGAKIIKAGTSAALAAARQAFLGFGQKLTRPHARKIVTEERNTSKLYNSYGFKKQAAQEAQHAKFFKKKTLPTVAQTRRSNKRLTGNPSKFKYKKGTAVCTG